MTPTSAAKARADKKVKRQKQFIAVGSVVLLAIVGFQMSKLMSHGEKSAAPATTATSAGGAPATPVPTATLPDTDRLVVQRNTDQLLSFGLFESKDPFVQQLSEPAPTPAPAPAPSTPSLPKATPKTATTPQNPAGPGPTPATTTTPSPATDGTGVPRPSDQPASPGAPSGGSSSGAPAAPTAPASAVLIATNGVCQQLAVDGTFPSGEDIFRVVSIAKDGTSVEIGVVGGSYDSGQPTATLKLGDKLTLVNTADGTRYVVELRSKCAVIAKPAPATTTRSTSTTPAPTTPVVTTPAPPVPPPPSTTTTTTTTQTTPTTTQAIVPDGYDTPSPTN